MKNNENKIDDISKLEDIFIYLLQCIKNHEKPDAGILNEHEKFIDTYLMSGGSIDTEIFSSAKIMKIYNDENLKKYTGFFENMRSRETNELKSFLLLHPPFVYLIFKKYNKDSKKDIEKQHIKKKPDLAPNLLTLFNALLELEDKKTESNVNSKYKKSVRKWMVDSTLNLKKYMPLQSIKKNDDTYEKLSFLHSYIWAASYKKRDEYSSYIMSELIDKDVPVCEDLISDYPYLKNKIPITCSVVEKYILGEEIKKSVESKSNVKPVKTKQKKI